LALLMRDWNTFDQYIKELESDARQELEWYYTDEIFDANETAVNYVNRQCHILDEVLNLKVRESQVRFN